MPESLPLMLVNRSKAHKSSVFAWRNESAGQSSQPPYFLATKNLIDRSLETIDAFFA